MGQQMHCQENLVSHAGGRGMEGPHSNPATSAGAHATSSTILDLAELDKVAAGLMAKGIADSPGVPQHPKPIYEILRGSWANAGPCIRGSTVFICGPSSGTTSQT